MTKPRVFDIFSGCGGISFGLEEAGYHVVGGLDNDATALNTFKANHKDSSVFCEDISKLDISTFIKKNKIKNIDVVVGGPPCQGMSISGKRDIHDSRNGLYRPYFEFVNELKPKVFVMENVPNLLSMGNGIYISAIKELFESIGYNIGYKVLLSSNFGVPQNRKRVVVVGTKFKNKKFIFPDAMLDKDSFITTKAAISDLPEVGLDDGENYLYKPKSEYQEKMRAASKGIFNHQITEHSDQTVKIISLVPDGGNYKDLPRNLQDTRRVNIAWTRYSSNKPSFTIDTGHRHHFHYKFNRIPTVRENARLQSFPDRFIFLGTKTNQYRHVGNAVPPILAEKIANEIYRQLL